MPLPDSLMERLKGAFVETDATQGDGAPALRVQYVAAASAGSGSRTMADNLCDRLKGSVVATDDTQGDGAPAVRAQVV